MFPVCIQHEQTNMEILFLVIKYMNLIPREALIIWLPVRCGRFIIKLSSASFDIWKGVRR